VLYLASIVMGHAFARLMGLPGESPVRRSLLLVLAGKPRGGVEGTTTLVTSGI